MSKEVKEKKPFYKRWWFILLVAIFVIGAFGNDDDSTTDVASDESDPIEEVEADETEDADEIAVEEEPEDIIEEEIEEDEPVGTSNEIVLGEPIELGDYTFTVQSYSLGVDYDGLDALIINYDWVNNSEETASPFMTFILKGFQDGVETSDVFMVDGVDLESSQKEVRPEGKIEGAQTTIGIDDLSKPIEIELEELFSFNDEAFTTTIDLSTLN